jgi:hypothetical protein
LASAFCQRDPHYLVSDAPARHFDSSDPPFRGTIPDGGTIDLGDGSMNSDVAECVESEEIILNVDVPDETLERAAGNIEGQAVTWIYCTHVWYNCGWPQ